MLDPSSHSATPPAPPIEKAPITARYRLAIVLLALAVALGLGWAIKRGIASGSRVESIGYTELMARGASGEVTKAEIDGERVVLKMKNGTTATAVVSNGHSQHSIVSAFAERGVPVEFMSREATG